MRGPRRWAPVVVAVACVAIGVPAVSAIDVTVKRDKSFDVRAARTWAWDPEAPGKVLMARTPDDDPEAMRARVEPILVEAVSRALQGRGLRAAPGAPDLVIAYYLLLTIGESRHELGQFLPAVPDWGLPPISAGTQSLEIMNRGSLVLDMSAGGRVVWRGVAQANIRMDTEPAQRERLLRDAVRDLVRRY